MPAVADNEPKYVGDVWIVEEIEPLGRRGNNMLLGVFDTLAGAQKFSANVILDPHYTISISKTAYYTTNWSDTHEE